MALKKYDHHTKPFYVKVDTRKGKPIVDSRGFIHLVNKSGYKGCDTVKEEEFLENFKERKYVR